MMGESGLRASIGAAFARSDDPYAGGDLDLSRRLGQILATASTLIALVLLPLAPPTKAIGSAGWIVCGGLVLISVATVAIERLTGAYSWNKILIINYAGVVQIGVAQWLAGVHAPYRELFLLTTVYVAGVHPPRRSVVFVTVVAIVMLTPLFFTPWDPQLVGATVALVLIWSALAIVVSVANLSARMARIGGMHATRMARAGRLGSPLTLMLGDLDRFKDLNDRHGHLAGDRCLKKVATIFRDTIRLQDRCFRWGGDEFAALLTDSDAMAAALIAERVELAVSRLCRTPSGEPVSITCAFAELSDGMTGEALLHMADAALLARKDLSRAAATAAAAFSAAPAARPEASGTR